MPIILLVLSPKVKGFSSFFVAIKTHINIISISFKNHNVIYKVIAINELNELFFIYENIIEKLANNHMKLEIISIMNTMIGPEGES